MTEYYRGEGVTLHLDEDSGCLAVLPTLPDASVDAIVCDPPYGLAELSSGIVVQALAAWMGGDRTHVPDGRGFMGREWDRFVPPPGVWDECLRVLKPGGHLVAFAGARTVDLMGLSIRIAGFEIRDSIHWIYGSGFPKSLDVSKAIDKQRDDRADILRVTTFLAAARDTAGLANRDIDEAFGFNGMAGHWTAAAHLKIAMVPRWEQWERLRELLGFGPEMDEEVWRLNGRKGTPGEAWATADVIRTQERFNEPSGIVQAGQGERTAVTRQIKAANSEDAARWQGWGTALKPAHEPIILARKPLAGTVAATVLKHGTGALNVDACRTEAGQDYREKCASVVGLASNRNGDAYGEWTGVREDSAHDAGRWPTNILLGHGPDCGAECAPGCPVPELGAEARFFPVFRYEAKAPASERPRLPDGTAHTTVKPLALMRWLVRLVTPPGGAVLDPFAGSGTTLEAAVLEGFTGIGIELERPHAELCRIRLSKPIAPVLFGDAS